MSPIALSAVVLSCKLAEATVNVRLVGVATIPQVIVLLLQGGDLSIELRGLIQCRRALSGYLTMALDLSQPPIALLLLIIPCYAVRLLPVPEGVVSAHREGNC